MSSPVGAQPAATPVWYPAWQPQEGAARASALFARTFGDAPDGTWSAPGRVNLIGEHTDYNAGLCLPVALAHRTYVALRSRSDGVIRVVSGQEDGTWEADLADVAPGTVGGWGAYVAGVAWAMRESGYPVTGFDAAVDSCVPYGAGLSSSAALECAVAVALDDVHGLGLGGDDAGRAQLVQLCIRAENEIAGAPTGGLDQSAALLCRPGHALLLDFRDGTTRHVPFDLAAHHLALLVIDTRAPHQLADGQYGQRRRACELAARALGVATLREVPDVDAVAGELGAVGDDGPTLVRRARHVVTENARVSHVVALLESGRAAEIGPVLTAAHASLRDDYQVSCPELDLAADTAVGTGALGARMVGGGFGGSVLALVQAGDETRVAEVVATAFDHDDGVAHPAFLVAEAAAPAGRVPEDLR